MDMNHSDSFQNHEIRTGYEDPRLRASLEARRGGNFCAVNDPPGGYPVGAAAFITCWRDVLISYPDSMIFLIKTSFLLFISQ
jgi:hypothetical protein